MSRSRFFHAWPMLVLCLLVVACGSETSKPNVVLEPLPPGRQYREGEEIAVQSTSTDQTGITSVELVVDGITSQTVTVPGTYGQTLFTCIQTWKAVPGAHMLSVHAHNAFGLVSEPVSFAVSVLPAAAPGETPSATPTVSPTLAVLKSPTPSVTASPTPTATLAGPCLNNAAFVADVTVPDGSAVGARQAFDKIWRVRNSGLCTWGDGYQLVFVSGTLMSAAASIAVPNTLPGATADLRVSMMAPGDPGAYTGQWQMRSADGIWFGPKLTAAIKVPGTPTPPPPLVPAAPSAFTAIGSGRAIAFTWMDNSTNESGFRIYQVGQSAPLVTLNSHASVGGMSYVWNDSPCNVAATFFVRAFNAVGESPPSGTGAAVTIPCAPDFTVQSATQMGSLYVNLTDNSSNEAGFRIYRTDSATPVATLAARPGIGGEGATAIGPFACGSQMNLFARAYNLAGESASSRTSQAVMLRCQVTVTFTSVDIVDAAHPGPGLAQIRFKFTVNNQIQYWPSATTYESVQNGDARTMSIAFPLLLTRDASIALKVEATAYENTASTPPALHYDLGKVEMNYTSVDNWGRGAHADESVRVDGKYRIHYSIAVTP